MSEIFTCCLDEQQKAQHRISRAIDRSLVQSKKENSKEFKLLLLGTGEAGKSTFIKQMRIIHGEGYSNDDRKKMSVLIFKNIIMGIQIMIEAMEELGIPYADPNNQNVAQVLMELDREEVVNVSPEQQEATSSIWSDPQVVVCFQRRNEFQISDSAKYYFDNLERICRNDYIPSIDDILRVRVPTTGITEYTFDMKRDVVFRMLDVGGQRSERRKWIHCFDDVKAIIFLTAINEYDQVLAEDATQNRMQESLALFTLINGYPWFKESSIILFLNKTDLFYDKITRSHLADHFPQFTGPKQDPEIAKQFILEMFNAANLDDSEERRIFAHFTQATDTENIKRVFTDVREHVLEQNLKDYNLM